MKKKIILSVALLGMLTANAETLTYTIGGYDNAVKNGQIPNNEHNKAVEACFNDTHKAADSIWKVYGKNDFKHINGKIIELCNYIQQTQLNYPERYVVHCGNVTQKFNTLSRPDGVEVQDEDAQAMEYAKSAFDNIYQDLKPNNSIKIKYNLKKRYADFKAYTSNHNYQTIHAIEDGYTLFKVNTTGRVKVVNNGTGIGYMLDQSPIKGETEELRRFYNHIVGSQEPYKVSKSTWFYDFYDKVKAMGSSVTNNDKMREKALLKNLRAIEYVGYFGYNVIDYGSEGKCYTFDIKKFDKVNTSGDPIRAKNFLYNNQTTEKFYLGANEGKNYSIHKTSNNRKGVYEYDNAGYDYKFSVNFREGEGKAVVTFYPDANYLEVSNKKIHLSNNGEPLVKRNDNPIYILKGSKGECRLSVDNASQKLILNQGNCSLNQENIEIIEKIGNFERPIFQVSGKDIVKGSMETAAIADDLTTSTAYVDEINNPVIIDGKVNPNTQYGDAIYTTIEGNDFYIKLDTANQNQEEIYVDFVDGKGFEIDGAYNENGKVEKVKDPSNPCSDKYLVQKMVLKLKAEKATQVNVLKYNQYRVEQSNGKAVCKQLASSNGSLDFVSNEFAIRPEYFEIDGNKKIVQEANIVQNQKFLSKEISNFTNLEIGYSKVELGKEDLALVGMTNNVSFTVDKPAAVGSNGSFDLDVNFPIATDVKIDLAETNFTQNDRNNGYCLSKEVIYDREKANITRNGKVHCYIPLEEKIDAKFTSTTKADNSEYAYCSDSDLTTCEGYDEETGTIISNENKIGIKNTAYDKLMIGDKKGLLYTLNLISTNANKDYVPTKYQKDLDITVTLNIPNKDLLSNAVIKNSDNTIKTTKVPEGLVTNLKLVKDKLNEKYKDALNGLIAEEDIILSSYKKSYTKEDATVENSTIYTFKKNKPIGITKVDLEAKVNGSDIYGINFKNSYDVVYTGLLFNDIKNAKDSVVVKDFAFGYFNEKYQFINDSKNFKEKNIANRIMLKTTYDTTKTAGLKLDNTSKVQYVKDVVMYKAKSSDDEYLDSARNTFTVEFIK